VLCVSIPVPIIGLCFTSVSISGTRLIRALSIPIHDIIYKSIHVAGKSWRIRLVHDLFGRR
jgi:hypothetical protein